MELLFRLFCPKSYAKGDGFGARSLPDRVRSVVVQIAYEYVVYRRDWLECVDLVRISKRNLVSRSFSCRGGAVFAHNQEIAQTWTCKVIKPFAKQLSLAEEILLHKLSIRAVFDHIAW